jgi:hypothetical protein
LQKTPIFFLVSFYYFALPDAFTLPQSLGGIRATKKGKKGGRRGEKKKEKRAKRA